MKQIKLQLDQDHKQHMQLMLRNKCLGMEVCLNQGMLEEWNHQLQILKMWFLVIQILQTIHFIQTPILKAKEKPAVDVSLFE